MAETLKVLGQRDPAPSTLTTLYVSNTMSVVSSLVVCNRNQYEIVYRVSVAVGDIADDVKQYLAYDVPLEANQSFTWTLGITLSPGDVIRVYSSRGGTSFNLFGVQVT